MKDMLNTSLLRRLLVGVALAAPLLASSAAFAGEIKVGQQALATDDKGNLTADGRKAAVTELDNVPGEDLWVAHVWAKIDNGGEGPLYFEFYQDIGGQASLVSRTEYPGEYGGEKFVSAELELPGKLGFNKNREYTIKALQVSAKGKDLELAKGKVKLIKSGKEPPKEETDEEEAESAQDEADSLGGEDEPETDKPATNTEAPPPVEPKKKGCSIDTEDYGWSGALVLLGIGGIAASRRRRR
ncbi:MAG: hypothetical protein R3B09_25815 [Nannocystaceae bacterium]